MQEFLASQERVSQKLYSNPAIYRLEIPEGVATINEEAAWPLLGTIVERNSDYLQAQRHFDLERDLFLQDHTLGGKLSQRDRELLPLPVMPFTLSMEMMAEAASYLLGGDKVVLGLSEVRGYRWLALDRGKLTVEIRGRVEPQGEPQMVQVQLWESSDLLFESRVRLADKLGPTPEPKIFPLEGGAPSRWSDKDLYRMGMFHGLRFQGVKHIREWSQSGIEAEVETIAIDDFFRDRKKPVFQIDGGMLDAATQLAAFWVTEQFGTAFHLFPFHLRAFHQYTSPLPPGTVLLCRGQIGFIDRQRTEANFEFIDQNGKAIASMEGLQSIYFPVPHPYARCRINPLGAYFSHQGPETGKICRRIEPISPEFWQISGGICQRAIAHLMLNRQERALWYSLPETSDRVDWLLGRIAAKDALRQWAKETRNLELAPVDVEIITTAWGETKVRCPPLEAMGPIPEISMDHRDGDVVATIAGSR